MQDPDGFRDSDSGARMPGRRERSSPVTIAVIAVGVLLVLSLVGGLGYAVYQAGQSINTSGGFDGSGFSRTDWAAAESHTIDNRVTTGVTLSAGRVAGMPAVSYYHELEGELVFARASAARPAQSHQWTSFTLDDRGRAGAYSSLLEVGGSPAVAYTRAENGSLNYAYSSVPRPGGRGAWSFTEVVSGMVPGGPVDAALIGGRPVLAIPDLSDHSIVVAVATASEPQSEEDWSVHRLSTPGMQPQTLNLAGVGGTPALVFHDSLEGQLHYASANSATPAAESDWEVHRISEVNAAARVSELVELEGRPMVGFTGKRDLQPRLAVAGQSPESGDDWEVSPIAANLRASSAPGLMIVDGRPVVMVNDTDENSLMFARATQKFPEGPGQWTTRYTHIHGVWGGTGWINLEGRPGVVHYQYPERNLKFSTTEEELLAGDE